MKLITGITEITVIMGNNRNGKIMAVFGPRNLRQRGLAINYLL